MDSIEELGEITCLQGLTDKQRKFVMAVVTCPGISNRRAAQLAGYGSNKHGQSEAGGQLLQNPKVLNAIRIMGGNRLKGAAWEAADFLVRAFADEKLPMGVRMKAATSVLDRVGLAGEQNIKVEHTHTDLTGAAMMARIAALAKKHGLDPDKLLRGQVPLPVVEAKPEPLLIEGEVISADAG